MRISVAMCTYNGARYLSQQLESIGRQTRLPEELVLCDDRSSDTTVQIAEAFAKHAGFPVRIVRNEQNLGYGRNFTKAVGICSGEVIALADQDDVWRPHKLARLAELFAAHPSVSGIFSNGDLIGPDSGPEPGDLWGSFAFTSREQARFGAGQALGVLLQRNVVTGMAFAFRSGMRDLLYQMPASWPHDAWLALRMAREGALLACPEHLVAYRVHGHQQIGVPITFAEKRRYLLKHGLGGYFALSRDRNRKDYSKTAGQYEDLVQLLVSGKLPADGELLRQARAKALHARRAMQRLELGRFRRWRSVLQSRQEYRQYSPTGTKAMLRDLLL